MSEFDLSADRPKSRAIKEFGRMSLVLATCFTGLFFATRAMAEAIKLGDVKVGAIVTREGIDLGGTFAHDYLPVPDGEWTVLAMKEEQQDFGNKSLSVRFVRLVLANRNPDASIPLLWVRFNPQIEKINHKFSACESTSRSLINDFGSGPSQFLYRCAMAAPWQLVSLRAFASYLVNSEQVSKVGGIGEVMQVVVDNPGLLPDKLGLIHTDFRVDHMNRYLTSWNVFLRTDAPLSKATFSKGNVTFDATAQWVQAFGDAAGKFVSGDRVFLPTFPLNPKSVGAGASDPLTW